MFADFFPLRNCLKNRKKKREKGRGLRTTTLQVFLTP